MAAPIESELKYELDARAYRALVSHFGKRLGKGVRQANYYFDDPSSWILRRQRTGLRLRLSPGKPAVLTLKFPARAIKNAPRSFKNRYEYEADIAPRAARLVIAGKRRIESLDAEPIEVLRARVPRLDGLGLLGGMTTLRRKAKYQGLTLELDRYDMFGERFYELEIETKRPSAADRAIRKLFEKVGIPCRPIALSKLGRFMKLKASR